MASESITKKAILLSGGIDSAALAYWTKPQVAIHISYGQKCQSAEIRAAQAVAKELSIPLHMVDVDCSSLGTGDLAGKRRLKIAPVSEWWPYRNQLLITLAIMKGISFEINELMIGAVKSDAKHKDGTKEFFSLINSLTSFQEGKIKISAPAVEFSSVELIKVSKTPSSILGWTHSCHKSNLPCGKCNGCLKHLYIVKKLKIE